VDLSFALDILVAALLAVTIVFAAVLNRRLGKLRSDRHELEKMAAGFQQATAHAEDSIGKLKISTETLQERIDKAQSLCDDLVFLIDRGGATADRIESEVRATRKHRDAPGAKPFSPAAKPRANGNRADGLPKSEAERDLLNALRSER
jgi:HAMP domain-containing protein